MPFLNSNAKTAKACLDRLSGNSQLIKIKIKSWQKFQSSSKKKKSWIKIHESILRSPEIIEGLAPSERWMFVGLLLLAKDREGLIVGSLKLLADLLQVKPNLLKKMIQKCAQLGLITVAIKQQLSSTLTQSRQKNATSCQSGAKYVPSCCQSAASPKASGSQKVPVEVALDKERRIKNKIKEEEIGAEAPIPQKDYQLKKILGQEKKEEQEKEKRKEQEKPKKEGNAEINLLFAGIERITGLAPPVPQQKRRYDARNWIACFRKRYPDKDPVGLCLAVVQLAQQLQDNWHTPKAHDPAHLFRNWGEITQKAKLKVQKNTQRGDLNFNFTGQK